MLSCHCGLDGHRLDCDHYRESTPVGSPALASGCESPDSSPGCPRCAALTRERDEARAWFMERFFDENDDREPEDVPLAEYAQRCFEWGDQAWYTAGKEAERSQMAARDLAQARQALQQIATHADGQPFSAHRSYYAEVKDIAREALVEAHTQPTRPCPNCNGGGKVRDSMHRYPVTCARCDGWGVIPEALVERGTEQTDTGGSEAARAQEDRMLVTNSALPESHFVRETAIGLWAVDALAYDDSISVENAAKWARGLFDGIDEPDSEWANGRHFGDCTKEPNTCYRCMVEEYIRCAATMRDSSATGDSGAVPDPAPVSLSVQEGQGEALGAIRDGRVEEGRNE